MAGTTKTGMPLSGSVKDRRVTWKRYRRHGHLSEAQQQLKALECLLIKHLSLGHKEGFGRMDGDTISQEDVSTFCVIYIWEVEEGVSVSFGVTALRVTRKEIRSC